MGRYRKRPEVVTAYKLSKDNAEEIAVWCGGDVVSEKNALNLNDIHIGINVPTPKGTQRLSEGEYIVRHENGKLELVKGSHFEFDYEQVD